MERENDKLNNKYENAILKLIQIRKMNTRINNSHNEKIKELEKVIGERDERIKELEKTSSGSSIGQDEHGQKPKATSSDDGQKRKAENNDDDDDDDEEGSGDDNGNEEHSDQEEEQKNTKKRKLAGTQTLSPDAAAAFGNGNGKGRGKGREFKVSTTDAGHTPGMRCALLTWIKPTADIPRGKWDRGGKWFLHKKKGEWKFMGRKSSITLKAAQEASGEWQEPWW